MTESKLMLPLGKLMIAVAWVDGDLAAEEINSLKDVIFNIPNMNALEWAELDIYIESPVSSDERDRLFVELIQVIRTENEKQHVLTVIDTLIKMDGKIDESEKEVMKEISSALWALDTSFATQLKKFVGNTLVRRKNSAAMGPNREERIDDFLRHRIYFKVKQSMEAQGKEFNIEDAQLRKLCYAGGLMARVAWVDKDFSSEEKQAIADIISSTWKLSPDEAMFVSEIVASTQTKDLDKFRITRGFFESTDQQERKDFLKSLFLVANASEKTSHEEIEEIRDIANGLMLSHQDFIDAKLTIPDEDLPGL